MSLPTTDDAELRTSDTEQEMWDLAEEDDPAQARRAYPSGWLWLTGEESIRTLLAALLGVETDARYGIEDLASRSGLAESEVEAAIDALISVGVLVADEGAYRVNEHSVVYRMAADLWVGVVERGAVDGSAGSDDVSGFEYLARLESVRLMLDALLETDPGQSLTQEDVHQLTGVSRKGVWLHVETLVDLAVVEESGDEYVVAPFGPVLRLVQSLDAAVVGATLAPSHP
jgi:biotin operon repressor